MDIEGFDSRQITLKQNGQDMQYGMDQLALVPMQDVKVFEGFLSWPTGVYAFEEDGVETGVRETRAGVEHMVLSFHFSCLQAKLKDASIDVNEFIGKRYTESVWLIDDERDFGKVKALLVNSGFSQGGGTLKDECERFNGSKHRLFARLIQTVNRDNKDQKFTNIDYTKGGIAPMQPAQEAAQAQAAAAGAPAPAPAPAPMPPAPPAPPPPAAPPMAPGLVPPPAAA